MSSRSLVSVIVIFLNEQRFLQEALDSILAQTYQNWEILLVDDGSADGSTQIARHFAASLPEKARYLEHKGHRNCGMSASRNLGISKARGQYLAFLDADDVWLPRKLEQQTAILESKPDAGMVYGPTQYWFSWTGAPGDKSRDYIPELGVPSDSLIEPPDLLARFLRNEAKPPGTCSVLARREAVEHVGGFEKSFRGLHEDQAFFAKMSFNEPIFVSNQCTARYRQHPGSCCALMAKAGEVEPAQETYLNWLAEYVCKHGGGKTEVWEILRRGLWPDAHPFVYRWLRRGQRNVVKRVTDSLKRGLRKQPKTAYEPDLVPPLNLMRQEGIEVLEEWFRWAEEWSMLLRLYGGITQNSAVLEIECGLGRMAFPLRYVLSANGSYSGLEASREKVEFLKTFQDAHPNFRFIWSDLKHSIYNPDGKIDASNYRFPYGDESFDIVFSASAFNHILPAVIENYFRETARTLKPGGRCLFGAFLLDHYQSGRSRPLGFAKPAYNFDYQYGDYGSDFAIADLDQPESMTAYRLRLIESLASQAGLELARPPLPGLWSGSSSTWVGSQDLIVLKKAGRRQSDASI